MAEEIVESVEELEEPRKERIWFLIIGVLFIYGIILVFSNNLLNYIVEDGILQEKPYLYQINLFVLLLIFFFLIVPFLFRIPNGKLSFIQYFKKIRLSKFKPIIVVLGLGILTSLVYLLFLYLSSVVAAAILNKELFLDFRLLWVSYDYSNYLYRAVIPGLWEEVAFRGVVLVLLLKKYSKKNSIIVNSLMFGMFHWINLVNMRYSSTPEVVLISVTFQVLYTTAAGFVFGYLFVKTKSLIPSILSHYLLDAFGPFLQVILVGSSVSLADLAILRTSQTILGIGFIPSIINVIIIYLVFRLWKKKPFLEEEEILIDVK